MVWLDPLAQLNVHGAVQLLPSTVMVIPPTDEVTVTGLRLKYGFPNRDSGYVRWPDNEVARAGRNAKPFDLIVVNNDGTLS